MTRPISDIKSDLGQAKRAVSDLTRELLDAVAAASPVKVGDIVHDRYDHSGTELLVRELDPQPWGTCWYKCSSRKKDGTWSLRTRTLITVTP